MIKEDGGKQAVNTFSIGTDTDNAPEYVEAGYYYDSNNMRVDATKAGQKNAIQKIKGEDLVWQHNTQYPGNWKCICDIRQEINGHVVEIWADDSTNVNNAIRIDGEVMCYTDKMLFTNDTPLQHDYNDSCIGGEFFLTDFKQPIYIFNVQDIIDNYGTSQKYFTQFNPTIFQAVLQYPLDHPIFLTLWGVGANNGMVVGKYTYAIRFVDSSGNRTNWSVQTPMIPVPLNYLPESVYAVQGDGICAEGFKTYGYSPDITAHTSYGIKIRFRVNNLANYSYVEIRRTAHNEGLQLGFLPTAKKLKFVIDANGNPVDIVANPIAVWDFLDDKSQDANWEDITEAEATQIRGSFTCKTLRYYNNRLVPMDIKYPAKDIEPLADDLFIDDNGELGFPVMEKMGRMGHHEPYNQVYFKNHQSGEKESFGVEIFDGYGVRTLVLPYKNSLGSLTNVKMPNRRNEMTGNSIQYSYTNGKGAVLAIDTTNNLKRTFERFDLGDINSDGRQKQVDAGDKGIISIKTTDYNPLPPISQDPTIATNDRWGLDYIINPQAEADGNLVPYNPSGFSPNYFSQGFAFHGIHNLPQWGQSFSIVKKKKAGRVVAQGIGIYRIDDISGKELNTLRCFFPDIDAAFLPEQASIKNSPSSLTGYKVQLVSPLGFFTELYSADNRGILDRQDRSCDIMSYARLIFNNCDSSSAPFKTINNNLGSNHAYPSEYNYYTLFGGWRNDLGAVNPGTYNMPSNSPFQTSDKGDTLMSISSVTLITTEPRQDSLYDIEINSPGGSVYYMDSVNGFNDNPDASPTRNFHEPFYIINIIDDGADFTIGNIDEYEETGHLQKVNSIIGKANGAAQTLILVDERWEDCIPCPFVNGAYNPTHATVQAQNKYAYVNDGTTKWKWLNVTYKPQATIDTILDGLMLDGFYDLGGGNFIYGVFKNDNVAFNSTQQSGYQFNIVFSKFQSSTTNNSSLLDKYFLPQSGYIVVTYDDTIPIRVFSGDSIISENTFSAIDRQCDHNGNSIDELLFNNGLPYLRYQINSDIQLLKNAASGGGIQSEHEFNLYQIRQWCVMFCCETFVNNALFFNINSIHGDDGKVPSLNSTYSKDQCYPLINYIFRPFDWDDTGDYAGNFSGGGGGFINPQYDIDFPGEFLIWGYGGFKTRPNWNIDYSKILNDLSNISKPLVGFKEETWFCSQVIWSLTRNTNVQDEPNLKTFPVNNVFNLSDKQQEIKYAYDNDGEKGNNLIAICGNGICLLITDKTLLSDYNVTQLALINSTTGFIQGEYWLTKQVGSNDEMWRGIAETFSNLVYKCFIPNNESVWMLEGTELKDIGRDCKGSYYSVLYAALSNVLSAYNTKVCAVYDKQHKEYWLHIGRIKRKIAFKQYVNFSNPLNPSYIEVNSGEHLQLSTSSSSNSVYLPTLWYNGSILVVENIGSVNLYIVGNTGHPSYILSPGQVMLFTKDNSPYGYTVTAYNLNTDGRTFVYSDNTARSAWQGQYDYQFDQLVSVKKYNGKNEMRVLGMRDLSTWRLNEGDIINGQQINGYVICSVCPEPGNTKEFVNNLFNSIGKPIRIQWSEEIANMPEYSLDSSVYLLYVQDYRGGYYCQIPRKSAGTHGRFQNNYIYIKLIHDISGDWLLKEVVTSYKLIV